MPGTTNFIQVNPSAANQEDDSEYAANTLTTDGIGVDAILPSPWLNKAWFQSSTFVAAIAAVMAGWGTGFTITDANITTLETQITDFFNQFLNNAGSSLAFPGYFKIGPFIIQWGTTGNLVNDTPTTINFPQAFPNACLAVVGTDTYADNKSATWSMYSWNTTEFTARCDGNSATATFLAVGW